MTKLYSTYKWVARFIVITGIIALGVVGVGTVLTGCSSVPQEEVAPIPLPDKNYKTDILGKWEGINSTNIDYGIRLEFMPNGVMYIEGKKDDKWYTTEVQATYDVYDNKILHMVCSFTSTKTNEPTVVEEFWHVTINGKVMYLSVKKIGKDGVSYVVTLTMKKINNNVAK